MLYHQNPKWTSPRFGSLLDYQVWFSYRCDEVSSILLVESDIVMTIVASNSMLFMYDPWV